ncbi:uncharacterized protein OGAPODRAFT_15591 [Ogataea polymorpha]|uniref:uncharacterized protein n=1 Tax=Ogataea polymorpha TaxID=460523 RepID=UPI0007F3DC6D|nr:uncharacterized protein OGAPODRAFT_15591 [Ogataea polymorpha]OBA17246.1 hypothetical protein OGAPODRAFT_15591 [Ogataea polymorpha]
MVESTQAIPRASLNGINSSFQRKSHNWPNPTAIECFHLFRLHVALLPAAVIK